MKALLLTDFRKLELTSLDRPAIGPNDVLVRVAACGICGSDVHGYDGSSGRRVPPIVMGHEAAGVVAEIGAAVDRVRVGDRVTFDSTISCGRCDECRQGQINKCSQRRVLGVSCGEYRQPGAFAEFVAVPQHIVYPLPLELPIEHAALIEPVAVALHAVDRVTSGVGTLLRLDATPPGQSHQSQKNPDPFSAVVVGSGMIGLLVIQALRVAGVREVIAIDLDPARLELAAQLGATATINAHSGGWGRAEGEPPAGQRAGGSAKPRPQPPAVDAVRELTGGKGADVALEVVGNAAGLATAIGCVRRGGRVGLVGNLAAEVPFPLQTVVTQELALFGSCASAGEYPRAIELVASGAIRVAPLISAIAPLAEGPRWFERLYAREPGLVKVVLKP
jgi:L-iditol 2-dehydrogenase